MASRIGWAVRIERGGRAKDEERRWGEETRREISTKRPRIEPREEPRVIGLLFFYVFILVIQAFRRWRRKEKTEDHPQLHS